MGWGWGEAFGRKKTNTSSEIQTKMSSRSLFLSLVGEDGLGLWYKHLFQGT